MSTPFYDLASLVVVPSGYKASKVYAQKPLTTDGQLTFSRASTASRVNSAGLIETVSSNVPRLDYLNSSCPRLLLEPQRTNIATYSEQFNNAAWLNGQNVGAATITANNIISPDGYVDADRIAFPAVGAGGQYNVVFQPFTASATAYTASVYLRGQNGGEVVWISFTKDGVNYNRTQCTLTTAWQRFTLTATLTAGSDNFQIGVDTRDSSQSARSAQTIYAWGAQIESASYASSYIPTTTAAVTRLADACSKTGISSLIGQTEGVFFLDFVASAQVADTGGAFSVLFTAGESGTNFQIYTAGTNLRFYKEPTTIDFSSSLNLVAGQRYKVAYAYKAGQYAFYANGVQLGTSTNASVPAVSSLYLNYFAGATTYQAKNEYSQMLFFKTRLTNAQLAELTTL